MAEESMRIDKYCSACGNGLIASAVICPRCGSKTSLASEKSKTVAVLLAVFLGFWAFLYTFKADKLKFFIALASIFVFFGLGTLVNFLSFTSGGKNLLALDVFGWLLLFGLWLWAVINVAIRGENFYREYGLN